MRRRAFLTTTATGLAALLADPFAPTSLATPALAVEDPIVSLTRNLAYLRRVDGLHGAGRILVPAEWLAGKLSGLLRSTPITSKLHTAIATLTAEATELAGWATFETGSHGSALRWYDQAIAAARAAGDRDLLAYVTEARARVLWLGVNAHDDALQQFDGIRLDGTSPFIQSYIHARRARLLADTGRDAAAHRSIAEAAEAAKRSDDREARPDWASPRPALTYVEIQQSFALAAMGIGDQSYELLSEAVEAQPDRLHRATGSNHLGLARAAHLVGDPELASTHVVKAHRILSRTSPRQHKGVLLLAERLRHDFPGERAVDDLDEQLLPDTRYRLCETSRHGTRVHDRSCRYANRGHARLWAAGEQLTPEEAARLALAEGHEICVRCLPA